MHKEIANKSKTDQKEKKHLNMIALFKALRKTRKELEELEEMQFAHINEACKFRRKAKKEEGYECRHPKKIDGLRFYYCHTSNCTYFC